MALNKILNINYFLNKKNPFLLVLTNSFLFSMLLLTILSCSKNPVEPKEEPPPPGSRDYVWRQDTLYTLNNTLYSIWGSAPDDVWLGGKGGITDFDRLWHFNGIEWKPYPKKIGVFPNCIFGFDKNNVWIGGNDGNIMRFNGTDWLPEFTYRPVGSILTLIIDINGTSPTNLYAIGVSFFDESEDQRSFLLHYNGEKWSEVFITNFKTQFSRFYIENGWLYISSIVMDLMGTDIFELYLFRNMKLNKIYSKSSDEINHATVTQIDNKVYFIIDKDLVRYENDRFINIHTFFDEKFRFNVYGRNLSDLFISMYDGVAHYNGYDTKYLFYKDNIFTYAFRPLILEEDVFFSVEDNINNIKYIIQGKLKNKGDKS